MCAWFSLPTASEDGASAGARMSQPLETRLFSVGATPEEGSLGRSVSSTSHVDSSLLPKVIKASNPSQEPSAVCRGEQKEHVTQRPRHPVCFWRVVDWKAEEVGAIILLQIENQCSTSTRAGPSSRLHLACYLLNYKEEVATEPRFSSALVHRKVYEFVVDVPGYGVIEKGPFERLCCNSRGTAIAFSNAHCCYVVEPPRALLRITTGARAGLVRSENSKFSATEPVHARPLLVAPLEAGADTAECSSVRERLFVQEAFHPFSETSILVLSHEEVGLPRIGNSEPASTRKRMRSVLRLFDLNFSTVEAELTLLVPLPPGDKGFCREGENDLAISFSFGASLRRADLWCALSVSVCYGAATDLVCCYTPLLPLKFELPPLLQLHLTDALVSNQVRLLAAPPQASDASAVSKVEREREALLWIQRQSDDACKLNLQPQATFLTFPRDDEKGGVSCDLSAACLWGASPLVTAIRCCSVRNGACKVECFASDEVLLPRLEEKVSLAEQALHEVNKPLRVHSFAKIKEAALTTETDASHCRICPLPQEATAADCAHPTADCIVAFSGTVAFVKLRWQAALRGQGERWTKDSVFLKVYPLVGVDNLRSPQREENRKPAVGVALSFETVLSPCGGVSDGIILLLKKSTSQEPGAVAEIISVASCSRSKEALSSSFEQSATSCSSLDQAVIARHRDGEESSSVVNRHVLAVREEYSKCMRRLLRLRESKAAAVKLAVAAQKEETERSSVRLAAAAASEFAIDCIKWMKCTDSGFLAVEKRELAELRVTASQRLRALGTAAQKLLTQCACEAERLEQGKRDLQKRLQNLREQARQLSERCIRVSDELASAASNAQQQQLEETILQQEKMLLLLPALRQQQLMAHLRRETNEVREESSLLTLSAAAWADMFDIQEKQQRLQKALAHCE